MFKKLALSVLSFLIFFFSFVPNLLLVNAAASPAPKASAPPEGTWYNQSFDQWYNKVYDETISPSNEIFGERYTAAQVQWIIYSLFAFVINSSLGNSSSSQQAVSCFITNSGNIQACKGAIDSLLGSTQKGTSYAVPQNEEKSLVKLVFADRPLSGITYVKERLHKFNLVPEVHAASAGFGFDALKPVQDMWRASRNIAFGLFVLVAIVLSFMIMFRVKISPQVVISIQSAIPKLIIALVLVTFSYAIAGFLIDLMYVVIGIFSVIIPQFSGGSANPAQAFDLLTGVGNSGGQGSVLGMIGYSLIYLFMFLITLLVLLAQTFSATALSVIVGLSSGIGFFLMIIFLIIAIVVCIWNMVRAWWMIIKAFVNILLLTIFAPLQITLGTFIQSLGFGSWVKSYISNLAVFVGTGVMMALAMIFLGKAWDTTSFGFTPEFLSKVILGPLSSFSTPTSKYWPPFLGSSSAGTGVGLLFLGASFVIFTLIPKVADVIQGFMSGKPFAYGSAVGEAVGAGVSVAKAGTAYGVSEYEKTSGPTAIGSVLRTVGFIKK